MSKIDITVKVNGKKVPLSDISVETFKKIRDAEGLPDIEGIELILQERELVEYLRKHSTVYAKGYVVDVIEDSDGKIYLRIPLPCANSEWTYYVWEMAKEICSLSSTYYPVHLDEHDTANYQYIRIYR